MDEYGVKAKNVEMFHNVTGSAMKGAGWLFGCDWLELLGTVAELKTADAMEGPDLDDYKKELAKIREDAIARYLTDHTIQPGELYEGLGALSVEKKMTGILLKLTIGGWTFDFRWDGLTAGTPRPGKHK